jgi:MFS family permease
LIPGLLTRVFHRQSCAVAGGVVAIMYFVGTIVVISASRLKAHAGLMWSLWLLLPSVGLLVLAETLQLFTLLIIASVLGGVATALGYLCSLRAVNELAPEERHSEVVSTYLIFCYIGISVPVIGVGLISKLTGPQPADAIFAAVIALLAMIALAVEFHLKHKSNRR